MKFLDGLDVSLATNRSALVLILITNQIQAF